MDEYDNVGKVTRQKLNLLSEDELQAYVSLQDGTGDARDATQLVEAIQKARELDYQHAKENSKQLASFDQKVAELEASRKLNRSDLILNEALSERVERLSNKLTDTAKKLYDQSRELEQRKRMQPVYGGEPVTQGAFNAFVSQRNELLKLWLSVGADVVKFRLDKAALRSVRKQTKQLLEEP